MANVLLGVTGGAAAFKAVSLASLLRREGHVVRSVLTQGACRFITPVQMAAVSGTPCHTSLFPPQPADPIPHITLTDDLDLLVVAPATAHFMGRAACGLADDLLTAVFLASAAPVVMAPAMNSRMWSNPAVQANTLLLEKRGVVMAGPVEGQLACGTYGGGRMMEPEDIAALCRDILVGRPS